MALVSLGIFIVLYEIHAAHLNKLLHGSTGTRLGSLEDILHGCPDPNCSSSQTAKPSSPHSSRHVYSTILLIRSADMSAVLVCDMPCSPATCVPGPLFENVCVLSEVCCDRCLLFPGQRVGGNFSAHIMYKGLKYLVIYFNLVMFCSGLAPCTSQTARKPSI